MCNSIDIRGTVINNRLLALPPGRAGDEQTRKTAERTIPRKPSAKWNRQVMKTVSQDPRRAALLRNMAPYPIYRFTRGNLISSLYPPPMNLQSNISRKKIAIIPGEFLISPSSLDYRDCQFTPLIAGLFHFPPRKHNS